MCDKGFIWNSSTWECECDKACDVGKYLDYENCKCKKKNCCTINWRIYWNCALSLVLALKQQFTKYVNG